ncbi:MAG TPA: LuxR C-terminal-related transcriptional regulator [Pseudonocardiaceae bacterium]|nr:LuxR C-terminal-related transcriptional regulator [Pseudonocardiaceae bacterium]
MLTTGRLVTLTGPGGVGKTRLAARIVSEVANRFPDGVVFVGLAELRDPTLLVNLVANRLELRGQAIRSTEDIVLDHLRDRRMLLVLDNCEHLVDACASLVDLLLHATHHLVILTTSRQSLGVDGEQVLPVPSLAVPRAGVTAPADLLAYDSARLFTDRAESVAPSFTVTEQTSDEIAWLCRQLDGLPLSIELAAAQLRSLDVGQLTERLRRRLTTLAGGERTAPDRQQTLRATIDWSYGLCSPAERLVWQRVSVFSGSFELDAAEQVCGGFGVDQAGVLDVLDGLLDKSVLSRQEQDGVVVFRMLETLREYGHERLEEAGDRHRVAYLHALWCRDLMLAWAAEWLSADQVAWVNRARRNLANVRIGAEFALSAPDLAVWVVRIGYVTYNFWALLGMAREAQSWVDRALPHVPRDIREYGLVRWAIGLAALVRNDLAVAAARLTEAGEFAERTGDEVLAAQVKQIWGMACVFGGDYPQAVSLLNAGLPTLRAHHMLEGELMSRWMLGLAQGLAEDPESARATLGDGLARSEERGEIYFRGWMLDALQQIELAAGEIDVAETAGLRALRLESEIGNMHALATTTSVLAQIAFRRGQRERAARLFGAADALWSEMGATPAIFPAFGARHSAYLERATDAFGKARFDAAFARGQEMSRESTVRYALEDGAGLGFAGESPLSKREAEVAGLVAKGLSNKDIAAKLGIRPRTAETHVDHILTKLGFRTRAQIAAWVAARRPRS